MVLNYADDYLPIFNGSAVNIHYAGSNLGVQIGSNTRPFAIVSISTTSSNEVVGGVVTKIFSRVTYNFEYTVVAGDLDSNGISIAANALTNSNGHILSDPAGNKITSVTIPVIADGSNNFRVNAPSVAPQQALDVQGQGAIDGLTVADAAGNTAWANYNFAPL